MPKSVEDLFGSLFSPVPGNLGLFPQIWQTGGDITRLIIRVLTETINPADGRLGDDWFVTTFPSTSRVLTQDLNTLTGRSSGGRASWGRSVPGGRLPESRLLEASTQMSDVFGEEDDESDLEIMDTDITIPQDEILPDLGNEYESNVEDSVGTIVSALSSDLSNIESKIARLKGSDDLMTSVSIYKEIVPVNTDNAQLQQAIAQTAGSVDLGQINDEFIENVSVPFIRSLLDEVQLSFQQSSSLPAELRSIAAGLLEDTISKL